MRVKLITSFIAVFLLCGTGAFAQTTYIVDQGGGGDFTTIQDCIDAAVDGDTCLVNPGTYVENIDFSGKRIGVQSDSGAANTTIDGNAAGSVVTFQSGEDSDAVLDGFTITNGLGYPLGGGIYCDQSSPTIENCEITSNLAQSDLMGGGGGIYCENAPAIVRNCSITDNYAGPDNWIHHGTYGIGGGIMLHESSILLENSIIQGNWVWGAQWGSRGGGIASLLSDPIITNCIIAGNSSTSDFASSGGGLFCESSSPILTNCTFSDNSVLPSVEYDGDGIYARDTSFPVIVNTILWDDPLAISTDATSTATVNYSDIRGGWAGTGNINSDPLFVDPANGDFHLQSGSPCIDAGNNSAPELPATDMDGQARVQDGDLNLFAIVDMGADEVPQGTWGAASTLLNGTRTQQDLRWSGMLNVLAVVILPVGALLTFSFLRRRR